MQSVPVDQVRKCQDTFLDKMRTSHPDVIELLANGQLTDEVTATIESTMADIAGQYKA